VANESPLVRFFLAAAEDDALLERYRKSPADTLRQHGVDEESIRVIVSGDMKAIRKLIKALRRPGIVVVIIVPAPR